MKKLLLLLVAAILALPAYSKIPFKVAAGKCLSTVLSGRVSQIPRISPVDSWRYRTRGFGGYSAEISNVGKDVLESLKMHPAYKIKQSPLILLQEKIAQMKEGKFDNRPNKLLALACEADKYGFWRECITCMEKAFDSDSLKVEHVLAIEPEGLVVKSYWPGLSRKLITDRYKHRVNSEYDLEIEPLLVGLDCCRDYMTMAKKYSPSHIPMLKISCAEDLENTTDLYVEAVDSILSNPGEFAAVTKEHFYNSMLIRLLSDGEYQKALDYFAIEPLSQYADSDVNLNIGLCTCAIEVADGEKADQYFARAAELDTAVAQEYLENIYVPNYEYFIEHPEDEGLAEWLVAVGEAPAEIAVNIVAELNDKYLDTESVDDWNWKGLGDFTPEQINARQGMKNVIANGLNLDNGASDLFFTLVLKGVDIELDSYDEANVESAAQRYDELEKHLIVENTAEMKNLRCAIILDRAYTVGHGLDMPKKAINILKKNLPIFDSPDITTDNKSDCYGYLAALYTKLGKKKDAEKYRALYDALPEED